jgi:hypothetical protein
VIAKGVEIGGNFQEVSNNDRPTGAIGPEMAGISVEKLLVDPLELDGAKLVTYELEEAARPIENLPDAARKKLSAMTGKVGVKSTVEELPKRLADTEVLD